MRTAPPIAFNLLNRSRLSIPTIPRINVSLWQEPFCCWNLEIKQRHRASASHPALVGSCVQRRRRVAECVNDSGVAGGGGGKGPIEYPAENESCAGEYSRRSTLLRARDVDYYCRRQFLPRQSGVEIRSIDVNHSDWEAALELVANPTRNAARPRFPFAAGIFDSLGCLRSGRILLFLLKSRISGILGHQY